MKKSNAEWFGRLWVLGLLALPGCRQILGLETPILVNVNPGPLNHISAVFCDVEKKSEPRRCASPDEVLIGVPLSHAAVAFTVGDTSNLALDYSPDAVTRCGGMPEVVTFEGPFPEGTPVCVNCIAAIGGTFADANALCVAECEDLNNPGLDHNAPDVVAFCEAHAHVSTNAPVDDCFVGACSLGGTLRTDFADPRRVPEPVLWQDVLGGASASLVGEPFGEFVSSLTRPVGGTSDAGAASTQRITRGDGYVEYRAAEATKAHVAGLSEITGATDTDASVTDIDYGIRLFRDRRVYVSERGTIFGPFGKPYVAGERFRVTVKENNDVGNTATMTYSRIDPSCVGILCPDLVFYTHVGTPAHYPLRVDASLPDQDATLTHVRLVRIK